MKKLFNKNDIVASCAYCAHGKLSPDNETILCKKLGIVDIGFSCRKFTYDPLKRQPRRPKPLEKFEEADFTLSVDDEE